MEGAKEIQILTPASSPNGVGVGAAQTDARALARVDGTFTSEDVRVRAGAQGLNAGAFLVNPGDGGLPEAWVLPSGEPQTMTTDLGAGHHQLHLSRAGPMGGFWSFIAGFQEVDDLDEIADLPSL
jgi:hypothetical protein